MVIIMGKTVTYDYDPTNPPKVYIDRELVDNMSEEELHERALSDPDAQPLTEAQLRKFKRVNPNLPKKKRDIGLPG
jgi:hypothetical protein